MPQISRQSGVVRFGPYEVHLPSQELFKHGSRIKLAPQSFRVLQTLLDRPGVLVTREEFHRALWPADTFVDFDQGLNSAIKKIRNVLCDSAETPRYIETLPKLGYRFIGRINGSPEPNVAAPKGLGGNGFHLHAGFPPESERALSATEGELNSIGSEVQEYRLRFKGTIRPQREIWQIAIACALASALIVGGTVFWAVRRSWIARPELRQQVLTDVSSEKPILDAAISPDGKYLAYADNQKIYLKALATGETRDLPQPEGVEDRAPGTWSLGGWYPDSSRFLANLHGSGISIWLVSTLGTAPHKLRDDAEASAVSPDGRSIAFTAGGIWLMDANGEHAKELVPRPSNHFLYTNIQWSPDGKRIAYKFAKTAEPYKLPHIAVLTPPEISIQTRDLNGESLTTVLSGIPVVDFHWIPDGRILFTRGGEERNDTASNLWEIHVNNRTGLPQDKPRQLTNWAGVELGSLTLTNDGKRLAYLRHTNALSIYVSEFDRFRHSVNSTRRLTTTQSWDFPYDWTSDGKAVIFSSNRQGHWNIYKQALDKDFPEMIVAGADGAEALAPRLSPDGNQVIYTEYSFDPQRQVSSDRIMRAPLAGGPSESIFASPNHRGKSCSRSPANLCVVAELSADSSELVFTTFDPLGGRGPEVERLPLKPRMSVWWTFSPDGKKISYIVPGDTTIHVLPLDHRSPHEIHVQGWPGFTVLTSAAQSEGYFADSRANGKLTLLFIEPSGKAYPLLVNKSDRNWAIPSRDGRLLATIDQSADGNVWMAENF